MTSPNTNIDELLREYFAWAYEAGKQDRGDLPELTRLYKEDLEALINSAKQREVDLTIINLIKMGLFTQEELNSALLKKLRKNKL